MMCLFGPSLVVVNNACFYVHDATVVCGVGSLCVCVQRIFIHVGELFIPCTN